MFAGGEPSDAPTILANYSGADGWWPEQPFSWSVEQHKNGTSTLRIFIYPFFYNGQTSEARFYKEHTFDVRYTSSDVQVWVIERGPLGYGQGPETPAILWVYNPGQPRDIVVSASVRPEGPAGEAQGLLLRTLVGVEGWTSIALRWDTAGAAPGTYAIAAEARTLEGELLDEGMTYFRIGVVEASIGPLTVTPANFAPGQAVNVGCTLRNTGTTPISATATIVVRSLISDQVVARFRQDVGPLAAGASMPFSAQWVTPPDARGGYEISAYALYPGRSTSVLTATARAGKSFYMPLIRK
jgi:hypothetical protein